MVVQQRVGRVVQAGGQRLAENPLREGMLNRK